MLELTLKGPLDARIDGSNLTPGKLSSMPLAELMALPLRCANSNTLRLDELFWVQRPDGPADALVIRGDCRSIDGLGHRMTSGILLIDGHAGDRIAAEIAGGAVVVAGSAGDEACMGMRGGLVAIGGDCGDRMGAPLAGQRSGIRGGDIMIAGNAGARACQRMRRGTVWIAGDVADHLAHRMVAGTILVQGHVSSQWGTGMRRGSLLFTREPIRESGASLSPGRRLELSFLPLIWKHLHSLQLQIQGTEGISAKSLWPLLPLPSTRWVDRRIGDLAIGGKGEVLILQRQSSITSS